MVVVVVVVVLVMLGGGDVVGCCDKFVTEMTEAAEMPHEKQDAEKNMLIKYLLFTYTNGCLAQLVSAQIIDASRLRVQFRLWSL